MYRIKPCIWPLGPLDMIALTILMILFAMLFYANAAALVTREVLACKTKEVKLASTVFFDPVVVCDGVEVPPTEVSRLRKRDRVPHFFYCNKVQTLRPFFFGYTDPAEYIDFEACRPVPMREQEKPPRSFAFCSDRKRYCLA